MDGFKWQEWVPFSSVKGTVSFVIGVVAVLFLLRVTGARKFVA